MDKNKIIEDTIYKLHKNLIDINDEIKEDKNFYLDRDILNLSRGDIESKFETYKKENINQKEEINKQFINMYKNKDEDTKVNYKKNKDTIVERTGY